MNRLTAEINRNVRGKFRLNKLDLSDPVEARVYENRRLELIAEFQPQKPVKLRKRS